MAQERNPDDPLRPAGSDERFSDAPFLDNDLQPDPELSEGPASPTRIALYAVAAAVILGAVFYGLNNSEPTTGPTSTSKSDRSVAGQAKPPVAPGVRDVTPYNTGSGVTTGTAPAQQPSPPPPASGSGKAQ